MIGLGRVNLNTVKIPVYSKKIGPFANMQNSKRECFAFLGKNLLKLHDCFSGEAVKRRK